MKTNIYQKIILIIYGILFIYFSIIHAPFKYKNHIEYDILFSDKSNLDAGRLALIILVITILLGIFFLLTKDLNTRQFSEIKLDKSAKIFLIFCLLLVGVYVYYRLNYSSSTEESKVKTDSAVFHTDSTVVSVDNATVDSLTIKKAAICTEEQAMRDFKSYMQFNYPDWKIFGKPNIRENSDCTYKIQFTTMNPHLKMLNEKEIIIAQISYSEDFSAYTFTTIRGVLY